MKIAVVGSINMDQVVQADKIPLKGETIHGNSLSYVPGGKGANQAVAMARLGADVTMFGCAGQDANGEMLIESMKQDGVNTEFIEQIEGVPTGLAVITVGDNDNTIVIIAGANDRVDRDYIDRVKEELLKNDMVLLQHEIPQDTVEYVIDLCHENGITTVLNPAPAREVRDDIIEKIDYLTPNEHEVQIIFGEKPVDELLKAYPDKLVVTQGSAGVSASDKDGNIIRVPVRKSAVVDTTGAGDTMNAAFAVRLSEGADVAEALKFANTAAGLSTEKFGAQGGMPTREEVEKELAK